MLFIIYVGWFVALLTGAATLAMPWTWTWFPWFSLIVLLIAGAAHARNR